MAVFIGAAMLVFATNKLTEDATLRRVLVSSLHATQPADQTLVVGKLSRMPDHLRSSLASLPSGAHELDSGGKEIQLLKASTADAPSYALIQLNTDSVITPFMLWLAVGTLIAFAMAVVLSRRLARDFSEPIEVITQRLQENQPFTDDPQTILEFAELLRELEAHRREQAIRLTQETKFAQSVSHELRTPITVIMGAVDLLLRAKPAEDTRNKLQRIKRATDNMRWTVDALLALARAEQQALCSDLKFEEALSASVQQVEVNLAKHVQIHTTLDNYPESQHEWAPLLVALQTLLSNAVNHTPSGSVSIYICIEYASVVDTGTGMSDSVLDQLRHNTPLPGQIGLAIVHRICERCDWGLDIRSGTTGTEIRLIFNQQYLPWTDQPAQ